MVALGIQIGIELCPVRDSKMRVLAQTTTFWALLSRANAVDEN